jgi:quercetin dioxygenase-like cupin family protein
MKITRNGSQASVKGPAEYFTGSVRIDSFFQGEAPARSGGAIVTFWHTHPLGQTLIVTSGLGWTQCEGGPRTEIRAGDVVWCPCQRRHWHGATNTTAMTHVAITEMLDGKNVEWMEHVTDEQYVSGTVVMA